MAGRTPEPTATDEQYVVIGRIRGVHGLAGQLRVESHTRPPGNLLEYNPWYVRTGTAWRCFDVAGGTAAARGFLVKLHGVGDRDAARALSGCEVAVRREQLPATGAGSWYWFELLGMLVVRTNGEVLGRVQGLQETGANDVLVVGEERRLVPFVPGVIVKEVDRAQGRILVDWDPEPL